MFFNKNVPIKLFSLIIFITTIDAQIYGDVYETSRSDIQFTVPANDPKWLTINWINFRSPAVHIILANDPLVRTFRKTDSWIFGTRWIYDVGNGDQQALFVIKPMNSSGTTRTVSYDPNTMNSANVTTGCYGYYAYKVDQTGQVLSSFCTKLYPSWMYDLRFHLGRFRIRELFIPGSHDSAAYNDGSINPNVFLNRYALAQDDTIRQQLLRGVRYLDLRIGYEKLLNPQFWTAHGVVRWRPLINDLEQVRNFAKETQEIIILDMHQFEYGLNNSSIHDQLVEIFYNTLSDVLVSPSIGWNGTLQDIWSSGRNVILSYNNIEVVNKYPKLLWPPIEQKWANVRDVNLLLSYLTEVHRQLAENKTSFQPVADMAELTPTIVGIITGTDLDLRTTADQVNPRLHDRYFGEFCSTANIVAVDFLQGTSVVDAAIHCNLKRTPRKFTN
ncbi:PI-PLC X domain-containing protein 2-like [Uranotaenia lowii]|uniref:PI-PLC X domain-containing protein 2-like n=1 Tax=Uranotaenia lowii TaxID=190385 RepID=UPI00247A3D11|nr:PI-PLC X domain-containing protein 2-like [Uranotaenia lowii]